MNIGFFHPFQRIGDRIRTQAVRSFLAGRGYAVRDMEMLRQSETNVLSGCMTLAGARTVMRGIFNNEKEPLPAALRRAAHMKSMKEMLAANTAHLLRSCRQIDIFHAETHLAGYVCAMVRKKTGIPFILDVHGLLAEEEKGHGRPPAWIRWFEQIEALCIADCDYAIAVSDAMKEHIHGTYHKPLDRIIVVPNGTEVYPGTARYASPLKAVYAGNFAYYEKVMDFVKTAELLKGSGDHEFYLMGDGMLRDGVFEYINRHSIDIFYMGKKSREETLRKLCAMQVGIAPSSNDLVRKVAAPIKVLDYAACGLPIVTPDIGAWSAMVKRYDCGIVTGSSDPGEFAEALAALRDEELWRHKSRNGKRMVEREYAWDKLLAPVGAVYRRYGNAPRPSRSDVPGYGYKSA